MANCSAGEFSELPRIADFFHSFPHENFYFDNVSSTFIPTLPDYQQALFLYALCPCLFGGLAFLIFCGHFIASWCSCDKNKQRKPLPKCVIALRCFILFASVISSGFIIAAFVFNDFVDQGVKGVLTAVGNVNNSLIEIQSNVNSIKDDLVDMDSTIIDAGRDLIDRVRNNIGDIVTTVVKIRKVDLPDINEYIQDIEYYRWWSTFGTLCMNTLTCILMIYAILRRSRCGFILAILLGIICLILIWLGAGIDLAVAIGMSDLCVNPQQTVYYYIRNQPTLQKYTGVVSYYMECPEGDQNPYQKGLNDDLNQSKASMSVIMKNLDCKYAHQQFESAQCFVCFGVVIGVAELLLMTLVIGFLLIVNLSLVLPVLLRTPPSKNRRKRSVLEMCGSDTHIGTPYHSISEDDNRGEAVPLIPSAPPPPTYNSTRRSSMEFHSFEDSWMPGRHDTGAVNPDVPAAPQPPSSAVSSNSSNPNTKKGEITSMAF